MIKCIANRWRVLSGQNNWQGLLNPIDTDLQKYIIHYGSMAQATYDNFNFDILSKFAGSSLYAKHELFSQVGLAKGNPFKYDPVKYIYATSDVCVPDAFLVQSMSTDSYCKQSNWIGFVAVATNEGKAALGRRDILIAWRGTLEPLEWAKDFDFPLVPATKILGRHTGGARVHQGFLSLYTSKDPASKFNKTSAREQVLAEVKKQVEKYKNEQISITIAGHSLGGALSTLNATDIVANGYNKPTNMPNKECPVTAFLFGSPKTGDDDFNETLKSMKNLHILNVHNAPDLVPRTPMAVGYVDSGVVLRINSLDSHFLRYPGNVSSWHDLEAGYLHTVGITDGGTKVIRDISLANKYSAALKDKFLIPPFWWVIRNKGMVQDTDGSWSLKFGHENDHNP